MLLLQQTYHRYQQGQRAKMWWMNKEKEQARTTKRCLSRRKKHTLWSPSSAMETGRQCHYTLFKHGPNVHTKEAILCSACFNVPKRQIKNSNLKVRESIFDEARGGKMRAHRGGAEREISACLWPRRCDLIKLTAHNAAERWHAALSFV